MNGARESDVDRVFSDGFMVLQGARIAYRSVLGVVSVSNYIWDIWGHTFEVRSIHMEIFLFIFSIPLGFLSRKNPNSFIFKNYFSRKETGEGKDLNIISLLFHELPKPKPKPSLRATNHTLLYSPGLSRFKPRLPPPFPSTVSDMYRILWPCPLFRWIRILEERIITGG